MTSYKAFNCLVIVGLIGCFTACSPIIITDQRFPEEKDGGEYELVGVPPGHLPPPGRCRIWYPGRPPGHQPPPFKCGTGNFNVPLGAWLLSRIGQQNVEVNEYDDKRANVVKRSYVHHLN